MLCSFASPQQKSCVQVFACMPLSCAPAHSLWRCAAGQQLGARICRPHGGRQARAARCALCMRSAPASQCGGRGRLFAAHYRFMAAQRLLPAAAGPHLDGDSVFRLMEEQQVTHTAVGAGRAGRPRLLCPLGLLSQHRPVAPALLCMHLRRPQQRGHAPSIAWRGKQRSAVPKKIGKTTQLACLGG